MGFSIASVGSDGGRIYHGETVTIAGSDFGSAQGTVSINDVAQTIVSWADTQIVFTVNAPTLGAFTLAVSRAG